MEKLTISAFKHIFDKYFTPEDQDRFRESIKKPEVNLYECSNLLIRYVMESFEIDHFIYRGKSYRTWTTFWDKYKGERDLHDPEIVCMKNAECELFCPLCDDKDGESNSDNDMCEHKDGESNSENDMCEHKEKIIPEEPVEYVMKFDSSDQLFDDEDTNFYNFMNKNWQKIKIFARKDMRYQKNITITNSSGRNQDHRGSTHCKIYVPVEECISISLPCTLVEFAEAIFRTKSHKWDKCYELFYTSDIYTYSIREGMETEYYLDIIFDPES